MVHKQTTNQFKLWRPVMGGLAAAALALLTACGPIPFLAGPAARPPIVGFLSPDSPGATAGLQGFQQGLLDHGYVDGQNVRVEYRWAEGNEARLHEFAMDLVALEVKVIVAQTNPATQAAKQATSSIPIVTVSNDPVGSGFVASLGRPGGNITGLSTISPEAVAKRLELLREVLPLAERVGVLWNPGNTAKSLDWKTLQETAPRLGFKLESLEAQGTNPDLDGALDAAASSHVQALMALNEPSFSRQAQHLANIAITHGLPTMLDRSEYVSAGGLMSYGVSTTDLYRRLVTYVDRVLKGAQPSDLPVEQPSKFELVINLNTARALRVTIAPSILQQATELIGN